MPPPRLSPTRSRRSSIPARLGARRRPSAGLAVALAGLLTFGCGAGTDEASGRDGYEIASEIVEADVAAGGASTSAPLELASADCAVEVSIDEYGFESEEISCADDGLSASDELASDSDEPESSSDATSETTTEPTAAAELEPASAADLVAAEEWIDVGYYSALVGAAATEVSGGQELADSLVELGAKLDRLEATCGVDEGDWIEALDDYVVAAEATKVLATSDQLGDYKGSVEAKAMARSLVERALFGSGCAQPDPKPVSGAAADGVLERTRRAVEATVGIDNGLRGSTYGPLFHLYSTLPNYLWMRNDSVGADTVLLGTSQLGAAIDLAAVNATFETEVGSAWIPGALAEVQAIWVDEVTRLVEPSTVVWFVGPLDLFAECDTTKRGVEFQRLADARSATFARGFVASPDPLDRILGKPIPAPTVRGDGIKREGFDAEGTEAHRTQYVPAFERGQFCHQRAKIISETVSKLEAEGRTVVVVAMPVHPELRTARPDTSTQMAMFDTQYLPSVELIDLTETIPEPEGWSDFTHLTGAAAGTFTDEVIARLRTAGIQ